jgi:hypothetical protein
MAPGHPSRYVVAILSPIMILNYLSGVSHRVTQSDVYEGHFIPSGAIVIPNVWYVFHL